MTLILFREEALANPFSPFSRLLAADSKQGARTPWWSQRGIAGTPGGWISSPPLMFPHSPPPVPAK